MSIPVICFVIFLDTNQRSEINLSGATVGEENGNEKVENNNITLSRILANASKPSFHERCALDPNSTGPIRRTHKCCAYIASTNKYCVRLNSIQAFMDINRDVSVFRLRFHLKPYIYHCYLNLLDSTVGFAFIIKYIRL